MTPVVVAAAIIERGGRLLVTKRREGTHLAGLWEFPGGKCHEGESLHVCIARELDEELDVAVVVGDELLATDHAYPDRRVELHFLRCELLGEPAPQLGQQMRWVSRAELSTLQMPPADAELVRLLSEQARRRRASR
jgi:8-oxo-dGTP diphosphatase